MKSRIVRAMLLGALVLPLIHGQSAAGRISGTITDATGAALTKAGVTVKNERTGDVRKATTNEQGVYLVSQVGPSTYTIVTDVAGMAPAEYRGVALQVGQERTLNIVVQPATVTTEVTVSGGDLAVVDTSSAAIGGN